MIFFKKKLLTKEVIFKFNIYIFFILSNNENPFSIVYICLLERSLFENNNNIK